MFRRRLAQCLVEWRLRPKAPGDSSGYHSILFSNDPILLLWPQSRPLLSPGLRVGFPATLLGGKGGSHPAGISPEPRGRSEQVTAGRGRGPRLRPYLFHVGRQLAPRVVVPNVELHVYVHDAGSPGRRLRPRPLQERRLPPARPRPVGGARGRPRASHSARPGLPHGQGFRQLGAARATGHRSSGERWQGCLGSSKFLPSFGPPEMALDLRHFRALKRG